jgi:hypothetical protein
MPCNESLQPITVLIELERKLLNSGSGTWNIPWELPTISEQVKSKRGERSDPSTGDRDIRARTPFDHVIRHSVVVIAQVPLLSRGPEQSDLIVSVAIPVAGERDILSADQRPGESRIVAWGYCIDDDGVSSGFGYAMGNDIPSKNAIKESNQWYQEKIVNRSLDRNVTCTSRTVVERFRMIGGTIQRIT